MTELTTLELNKLSKIAAQKVKVELTTNKNLPKTTITKSNDGFSYQGTEYLTIEDAIQAALKDIATYDTISENPQSTTIEEYIEHWLDTELEKRSTPYYNVRSWHDLLKSIPEYQNIFALNPWKYEGFTYGVFCKDTAFSILKVEDHKITKRETRLSFRDAMLCMLQMYQKDLELMGFTGGL